MAVEIEKNDDIWTIVLHRPEVRNAVDHQQGSCCKVLSMNLMMMQTHE